MYCCARGTFHCQYTNGVQFGKLKTKYKINKDIIVEYSLQDKVRTSTRDWIGIFPRGWINLQQYLTFEYVVVPPEMASLSNRSIAFLHSFHQEASLNTDYHFVYVSKEIEILGTSTYFRFVVPPSLRPLDRCASTPEHGLIVDDLFPPTPVTPTPSETGKFVGTSKLSGTIDGVAQPHRANSSFADHRQRMCRFRCTSRLTPSITANRVQFLMSHNTHLGARVGRLARDLELAEATIEREKMARAVLTGKLQSYETFLVEMFKSLNLMGIVKITNKTGKEIYIQKMKLKDLSRIRNKPRSIPEVTMFHQGIGSKAWNFEETLDNKKFEEDPQDINSLFDELMQGDGKIVQDSGGTLLTAEQSYKESKNFEMVSSIEELPSCCQFPKTLTEAGLSMAVTMANTECLRGAYVTKEATGATNDGHDSPCKDNCNIEETNDVEGKAKEEKNNTVDDKGTMEKLESSTECCCDCHLNSLKSLTTNKKQDEDDRKVYAFEYECDMDLANGLLRTKNDAMGIETLRPKQTTIFLKGRMKLKCEGN
ncbi:Calcium-binding and coiled-coil domain-containing protein 1-A [Dufourea novaeangliae]|uniref:Calcium-binding and coiled-coil domain-containing protein 1-A n=1 Tax=Dufourea novaeangliae TaxID=178035 RepID=A0A154PF28_DUFNO|nr:Calcium-binding and coiled-coil domain-containing protein 1-A [Dufourea novaeangliae]